MVVVSFLVVRADARETVHELQYDWCVGDKMFAVTKDVSDSYKDESQSGCICVRHSKHHENLVEAVTEGKF